MSCCHDADKGGLSLTSCQLSVCTKFANVTGTLDSAQETTCGTESGAGGIVAGHLDPATGNFEWWIGFGNNGAGPNSDDGLLLGIESSAHFHGPAAPGFTGATQITTVPTGSPKVGSQILTPTQRNQLEAGQWYYDITSSICPSGEIRAQLNYAPIIPVLPGDWRAIAVAAVVTLGAILYWRARSRSSAV